jgi:WD40 repeat protein
VVAGQEQGYDAFISYSHRLDATIAARLQSELQRFAKPWYRMRALHVFRDQTSLAASPHLWTTIEQALADSRWLILMASPESAGSPWVAREIAWWRAHRPISRLLVAVTAGDLAWDDGASDLDWAATTALSKEALGHAFQQEPRWVDLRWARDQESSLRSADPRLQDAVADLAAAIRQVPKDTLIGEHIRQRRRTLRAALAVAMSLVLLVALAVTAAVIAKGQRDRATAAETTATAGQLASTAITLTSSHPDLAQLFAVQAFQLDPGSPQARAALFAAVQADPQVQRFIQARGPVSTVASSADGRTLVAGTTNGWVQTWNLASFQLTSVEQLGYPVTSVAASADGTTIVAAGGPQAQAWVRGQAVRPSPAQPGALFTAAGVSPSGRFAVFASFPYLDVLNTKRHTLARVRVQGFRKVPRGRPPTVTDLAIPSDSQVVAFDGRYGSWQRIALPGLASIGVRSNAFGTGRFPAYAYALSPTGLLATHSSVAAGSRLRVWSTGPGHRAARTAHPGGRLALALTISRDGEWLASQDADGIYVSRISGRGQAAGPAQAYPGAEPIFDTSLSFLGASDSRLVSASGDLLTLWNLKQYSRIGKAARIRMPWRCGQVCPGPRLAISPDGREAVITDSNGDLLMAAGLNGSFGQMTNLARGSTQAYGYPEWVAAGHRLWVYGTKLRAMSPRAVDRSVVIRQNLHQPQYVTSSPDGKHLVEIDAAGDIRLRSTVTGRVSAPVSGPSGLAPNSGLYQRQAAANRAGTRAAVIDQASRSVYVVSTRAGTSWPVPGIKAYELAYAGERLVIQRVNGTLDLRGPDGRHVIRSVQAGTPWNYGNIAVTSGPSGPLVAEERANGQGVIADMGSGHLLGVFPIGKTSPYQQTTMAFSPGGGSLVTVTEGSDRSADGVLTQLSMSPRQWVTVACATAGHRLTRRDWQQYISATPPARLGCTG